MATSANKSKILDGKAIAAQIRGELTEQVKKLVADGNKPPGIGVVLVGDRKDSATYVRMKGRACRQTGVHFELKKYTASVTQEEIIAHVQDWNKNEDLHGILVQLPLPDHIDEKTVLDSIAFSKDVDAFHPMNVGHLAMKGREPQFTSCTPKGCMELLKREGIEVAGKEAVVLGRSNIVGIPMALLLNNANATVTICHSRTPKIEEKVKRADIVVAAIGKPEMVKKEWLKEGAVVLDVGINSVTDASTKRGYRLVGDVAADAIETAGRITPVPGGVGPMTIAMLLQNTIESAKRAYKN